MAEQGWAWFAPPEGTAADGLREVARAAARALTGPDGARLLAHLRAVTIERRLGPEASEAALRHLEGQRALVAHLEALVERGRG
mgnify:FL=1